MSEGLKNWSELDPIERTPIIDRRVNRLYRLTPVEIDIIDAVLILDECHIDMLVRMLSISYGPTYILKKAKQLRVFRILKSQSIDAPLFRVTKKGKMVFNSTMNALEKDMKSTRPFDCFDTEINTDHISTIYCNHCDFVFQGTQSEIEDSIVEHKAGTGH